MKIIALRGESGCGKSTTLKNLIIGLLNDNFIIKWWRYKTEDAISALKDRWFTKSGNVSDVNMVLQYKNIIIAITTLGDNLTALKNIFDLLQRHTNKQIDIFVCACHSNSRAEEWLHLLVDETNFVPIEKHSVDDNDKKLSELKEAVISTCKELEK